MKKQVKEGEVLNMTEFFDKNKALQIVLKQAYDKGISQSKLIEGIYDYSHFNRMCNGKESVKIEILVLCCIKLDISFDQIIKLSKESKLLELDEYYNQFEIIRLKRNYKELETLYLQMISDISLHKINKYKIISTHMSAIIEAQLNNNFNGALRLLEQAFELSGYSINNYKGFSLNKEQVEILIDYSICCFLLHNSKWNDILLFLKDKTNKYIDDETFDYIYPKILYNISTMYLKNEDYVSSLMCCEESIEFCIKKNNFIYLPFLYYNAACCLSMLKRYEKAKEYLTDCKNIFKLQNNLDEYKKVYNADYSLYFNKRDFTIQ